MRTMRSLKKRITIVLRCRLRKSEVGPFLGQRKYMGLLLVSGGWRLSSAPGSWFGLWGYGWLRFGVQWFSVQQLRVQGLGSKVWGFRSHFAAGWSLECLPRAHHYTSSEICALLPAWLTAVPWSVWGSSHVVLLLVH